MSTDRKQRIEKSLEDAFRLTRLQVKDQSHLHAGHAGAADGKGHFEVVIVSEDFSGRALMQRHRLVFEALGDMMETDIHALKIVAKTPDEG